MKHRLFYGTQIDRNYGHNWILQEDGTYTSPQNPGKVLTQEQINNDVKLGFLKELPQHKTIKDIREEIEALPSYDDGDGEYIMKEDVLKLLQ